MTQSRKELICKSFSAAEDYDQYARVQLLTAARLATRIAALPWPVEPNICEIGCGTGLLSEALAQSFAGGRFLATDLSLEMVERTRRKLAHDSRFNFARADAERPENLARRAPFDLICSSFAAQWFSDLPGAVSRLVKLLSPGGRLVFAIPAAGTFSEWCAAHSRVGLTPGTPRFPEVSELLAMAPHGVAAEVDVCTHVEHFTSVKAFLQSLRAIGAGTPSETHRSLNAGQMRKVMREFSPSPQATYQVATCNFTLSDPPRLIGCGG